MKVKPLLFFGLIAVAIILGTLFSVIKLTPDQNEFNPGDIVSFRKAKDLFLKQKIDSPFYRDLKFDSLYYYSPNPKAVFRSDIFKVVDGAELDLMPDRTGYASHKMVSYAILESETWRDTLYLLKDLEEESDTNFFVPFSDQSNGRGTYGGGRYLDLVIKPGRQAVIDFNFAYNPYCAYKPEFVCPKIPKINKLSKAIQAGEKNYAP
jgi:uncharacterized protein (DUF1684 family)